MEFDFIFFVLAVLITNKRKWSTAYHQVKNVEDFFIKSKFSHAFKKQRRLSYKIRYVRNPSPPTKIMKA